MMAPHVGSPAPRRTNHSFPRDDPAMISAMDSESTDGESSLLSGSGPDVPSVACLQGTSKHFWSHKVAPLSVTSPSLSGSLPTSPDGKLFGEQPLELPTDQQQDEGFFFETDHVSLKGNSDYQALLRSVILLESQRQKAIEDVERLLRCKRQALQDPIGFVGKLQSRADLDLPRPQDVAELPAIDWDCYMASIDPLQLKQPKHMTRHTFRKQTDDAIFKSLEPTGSSSNLKSMKTTGSSLSTAGHSNHINNQTVAMETTSTPASSRTTTPVPTATNGHAVLETDLDPDPMAVRGRVKQGAGGGRSATFNQLWTTDEQRRLEELLVKYPPEEVEMKRWGKIAAELGNRTTLQVASRVQKYFIKLTRAGLPVPGRHPGSQNNFKRQHRHHRQHKFLWGRSTFLASYEPPVYMTEDDDDSASYSGSLGELGGEPGDVSDEEAVPTELRDSDEYLELLHLKRLRKQKLVETCSRVRHLGFKCDLCDCEPIVGVRWHCTTCPSETSVDFCDNCADFVYETRTHKSSHQLDAVREAETLTAPHVDRDYTRFMGGDYNYLDPNYMPAS